MKVLVLGAYGMLGHKLVQVLGKQFEVYATCRKPVSAWNSHIGLPPDRLIHATTVENYDSIVKAFGEVRPDVVVNCIGVIKHVDEARDPISSISVNALFPHRLAALCRAAGSRLIHFSTDCVFSGQKGMYSEDDPSDATDLYGKTKHLGEIDREGCLTIRSSFIGPELGTNVGLVEWFAGNTRGTVQGYKKAIYSGLTTLEMAKVVSLVLNQQPDLSGIWQVASEPISKFDLLGLINHALNLGIQIEPNDDFFCDRSLNGGNFGAKMNYLAPSWPEMVRAMAEDPVGFVK